jgi:hypothetical protein
LDFIKRLRKIMLLSKKRITQTLIACGAMVFTVSAHAQASSDANVPAAAARKQSIEIAQGDPARWHQEDATMAARLRTIRKEIAAGLQENLGVCKSSPASERSACVKEARATYQLEMAGAKARAAGGE